MRIRYALLSALFCLMSGAPAWPRADAEPDLKTLADAVDAHYNRLHSLEAQFTELYRGSGMERNESGTVWLKKPGKMRWEYRSPEEKLFVSDGKDAWFYVPEDHQARRTEANKLNDLRSPLEFLLGKAQLEKELRGLSFAPDLHPLSADDVVLRGVPQALGDQVNDMQLEVNPQREIVRIVIDAVDGSSTEYRFSEQKANVAVPAGWFHFDPPAGTETIEGLEQF